MVTTNIGRLLRDVRELQGLEQKATAKKIGVTEQFLGRIELGKCYLPFDRVKKVQAVLGIESPAMKTALLEDFTIKIKKFVR